MIDLDERFRGLADQVVGKAKRVLGELTARPDMVLDGEAQDALGYAERRAAMGDGPESPDGDELAERISR